MSQRWKFYNLSTGLMLSRSIVCDRESAIANSPSGYAPIPCEQDSHLCHRVDVGVQPPPPVLDEFGNDISPLWYPPVVDYQPPAPADDAMQTWAWDAGIKRWVATPTLAAIKQAKRGELLTAWSAAKSEGVTIAGKAAPTDADSWVRYLAIKEMAADGGWVDMPIPLKDGTFELMTQAKMVTLWGALKTMERTLLTRLRDRMQSVTAATTEAEVAAVVW